MGPVQILVVGFEDPRFQGEILQELQRLKEHDVVRLLDLLVVLKDDQGNVSSMEATDLPQPLAREYGAIAKALIGFGGEPAPAAGSIADAQDSWDVVDAIPDGSAAAIALLEHRWVVPLRHAIERAGGVALADAWVHRDDLAAVGLAEPDAAPVPGRPSG